MLIISRDLIGADGAPSPTLLLKLLDAQHSLCVTRLDKLHEYYERRHAIDNRRRLRGLPNNRLSHDLPGYIVAVASGYLIGAPVQYSLADNAAAFDELQKALDRSDSGSVDAELAVDASAYGKGVELCYADEQAQPRMAELDARSAFVVYDDTVEHKPLFGVMTVPKQNELLQVVGEYVTVYTPGEIIRMERISSEAPHEIGRERHFFGGVPMVEYWNNARETGDFEGVLPLIDAYDALQSDRVNDKQQFTDAIMVLKGVGSLGVDDTEEVAADSGDADDDEQPAQATATAAQRESTDPSVRLRQTRTLFLPGDGADAGYITKPDAESGNEVLRSSLADDIHKLSFVPDLTDEKFSGDTSGVAMRFKLLGLEQLTKIKERWFREALRTRLRLFAHFLALRGVAAIDADAVQIAFQRSLPVNDLEIAQTAQAYADIVSRATILKHIPWVDDADAELQALQKEQAEAAKQQQEAFGGKGFRDGDDPDDEPDDKTEDEANGGR